MSPDLPPPVACAAFGAATAFYGILPPAASGPGICVLRASIVYLAAAAIAGAALTPFAAILEGKGSSPVRLRRRIARSALAFAAGVVVGTAASERSVPSVSWGMGSTAVASVEGRLASDPRKMAGGRVLADLDLLKASDGKGTVTSAAGPLRAFVSVGAAGLGDGAVAGAVIRLSGSVEEFGPASGGGVFFKARRPELVVAAPLIGRARSAAREAVIARFARREWGGLAVALLLGSKDLLEEGEGKRFTDAGCAHVLALSGMHLAVLTAALAFCLRRPIGLRASLIVGVAAAAAYVGFAGVQASLLRALLMFFLSAWAQLRGFRRAVLPLLCAAFLIQLCWDPVSARSLSFTLSYLALAGIAILAEAVVDLLPAALPKALTATTGASVGAFLATVPLCALAFGAVRPAGLVAGALAGTTTSIFMMLATVWLGLDFAWSPAASLLDPALRLLKGATDLVVNVASRAPPLLFGSPVIATAASLAAAVLLVYGRYRLNETRNRVDPID